MAKEKKKLELPSPGDLPGAAPILKDIEADRARVHKAREGATQDGTVKKSDPAYRSARKKLKRSQRRLRRELIRVAQLPKPKEQPEAAPAAPAAAPAAPAAEPAAPAAEPAAPAAEPAAEASEGAPADEGQS